MGEWDEPVYLYGGDVVSPWLSWIERLTLLPMTIWIGLRSGYPLCCVLGYTKDTMRGIRFVALYRYRDRPDLFWDGLGYVQCGRCLKVGRQ